MFHSLPIFWHGPFWPPQWTEKHLKGKNKGLCLNTFSNAYNCIGKCSEELASKQWGSWNAEGGGTRLFLPLMEDKRWAASGREHTMPPENKINRCNLNGLNKKDRSMVLSMIFLCFHFTCFHLPKTWWEGHTLQNFGKFGVAYVFLISIFHISQL